MGTKSFLVVSHHCHCVETNKASPHVPPQFNAVMYHLRNVSSVHVQQQLHHRVQWCGSDL